MIFLIELSEDVLIDVQYCTDISSLEKESDHFCFLWGDVHFI